MDYVSTLEEQNEHLKKRLTDAERKVEYFESTINRFWLVVSDYKNIQNQRMCADKNDVVDAVQDFMSMSFEHLRIIHYHNNIWVYQVEIAKPKAGRYYELEVYTKCNDVSRKSHIIKTKIKKVEALCQAIMDYAETKKMDGWGI